MLGELPESLSMGFLASFPTFHSPPCDFDILWHQGRYGAFPDGARHLLAFIFKSPKGSLLSFQGQAGRVRRARPPQQVSPELHAGGDWGCGLTPWGATSWPRTSSLEGLSFGSRRLKGQLIRPRQTLSGGDSPRSDWVDSGTIERWYFMPPSSWAETPPSTPVAQRQPS